MLNATMMNLSIVIGNNFNMSILALASYRDNNFTNINASNEVIDEVIVSPTLYYLIGSLMIVIMVTGFSTNLAILYTYATNRKIRTVDNTLIIGLAMSDIGQAIFGIPFVAIASFSKRWIFGNAFCQYYAFITTSFGIAQISMLTVIAMERYLVIVRHDRRLTNTTCRCVLVILCSFIYGSSWATGPLLGWSGYKEEEIGIACCVKWEIKDNVAFSYTISICTFGWFIPLLLIAYGYISIACSIYNERNKRLHLRRQVLPNKTNRERKVAITVLIMIGAFIVSWTPYSAVSLWSAVGNFHSIPLWVQVAPAVFAKCSIIWNPLIYVARHEHFRQGVKQSLSYLKFWAKDLNNTKVVGFNTIQPPNRRRQQYREIATNEIRDPRKHSVTSDNCVTYTESHTRRESSSVFFKSPASLKRKRFRRHLTFFSTLEPSQQIMEKSEANISNFVQRLMPCESKHTQTEYVFVHTPSAFVKEVSEKGVQTNLSHPIFIRNRNESTPCMEAVTEHNVQESMKRRNDVIEIDNQFACGLKSNEESRNSQLAIRFQLYEASGINLLTANPKSNEESRQKPLAGKSESYEENKNDNEKSPTSSENGTTSISKKPRFQKTKSLEVLKKKRKVLKQQLETIYKDLSPDVLPICGGGQQLNKLRCIPSNCYSVYEEKETERRLGANCLNTFNCRGADTVMSTKSDFKTKKQRKHITSMSERSPTHDRFLQLFKFQKHEQIKRTKRRKRIVSEPTEVEMQTYRPVVKKLQEADKLNDTVININSKGARTTILRQSTV